MRSARSEHDCLPDRLAAARLRLGVIAFIIAGFLAAAGAVLALECGSCGAKGLSALTMFCPKCRQSLHTPQIQRSVRATAVLSIDLVYTGDRPDRLPEYGKLFINGVYKGNIPLIEREARQREIDLGYNRGLGHDYTAKYHADLRDLDVGVVRVEVEMKFKRLFGFARSFRRVCFPYVSLRSGEKTILTHSFSRGSSFQIKANASAPAPLQLLPGLPGLPSLNDLLKISPGTGTMGIEVPFFE